MKNLIFPLTRLSIFTAVFALTFYSFTASARSDHKTSVVRIEIGQDYKRYSNKELRKRLWRLEQAVWQLQEKVFRLQSKKAPAPVHTWACTISAMGDSYTASGASRAVAKTKVISQCKKARGDGFFCKDATCEQ